MNRLEVRVERKLYPGTGVTALQGLKFSAAPGEFLCFVGPSGAGKSTLLNVIGGLDKLVDGDVRVDGGPLHPKGAEPRARIGYMFQDPRLIPWLTALDNLCLVLDRNGESAAQARHLLKEVGLADNEKTFPGQLSGGMQRRLALARAFVVRPALMLMDEPFVSLDAPTAMRLRGLLLELWHELRPTVLFVTHNLREALALADRVLFLSGSPGRVVLELPVDIPRPRDLEDHRITALRDRVLSQHPDLLSGLSGLDDRTVADPEPVQDSQAIEQPGEQRWTTAR